MTLFLISYEKKKYKTFLTPFTVLFFPTVVIIFINNIIHPFAFYKVEEFSQFVILGTEIIFILPSLFFKNIKIKKNFFILPKWLYYIMIITLIMIILRFLYEVKSIGGIKNFELLKLDKANNVFSNFVEIFSIFVPILFILGNKKNKFLFILFIFFQLLFQNKNRVFILILQALFFKDIYSKVKLKLVFKYLLCIIGIFFIIYNLKGFAQVGFALNIKKHNLEILQHVFYYLISPVINIQNLANDKLQIKGWYHLLPIVGVIKKLGIDLEVDALEFNFYDIGMGKSSNVGSIFGEAMYVSSNVFIYGIFFMLLSLFTYYFFSKRARNVYYSTLSSFLLATLSLSFFSNIFSLIFIWKRIFLILLIIVMGKGRKKV